MRDFPSRPIYGVGERSGIRLRKVVPRISWLLFKGFFWRLREKYVIRDFHPLVFFYVLGLLMTRRRPRARHRRDGAADPGQRRSPPATIVLVALLLISGLAVHAVRDVVRHGVEQGPAGRKALQQVFCSFVRLESSKRCMTIGHPRFAGVAAVS